MSEAKQIKKVGGRLGVLTQGMGAVATTFFAGAELVKRGLAEPVGSLTQLGTIRLGKRTEDRTPKIRDFVPLAGVEDLIFGA
jgi:myo-inositol-1-phosphate synthase